MDVIVSGQSEITIRGDIKSIEDYLEVKKIITQMIDEGVNSISVKIPSSPIINSALIGFFLRLINENKVNLTVYAGNERLLNFLRVMNLLNVFHVKHL